MAWGAHTLLAYALLKGMNLPTMVSWGELGAYVGYTFVPACAVVALGMVGGGCRGCVAVWLVQ